MGKGYGYRCVDKPSTARVEFLRADRSWCNESEGKNMFGCFSENGIVLCYVPTDCAAVNMCKFFGIKYVSKKDVSG